MLTISESKLTRSAQFALDYPLSPAQLRAELYKKKHISHEAQCCLISYKLMMWNKELLEFKLTQFPHAGMIRRYNVDYLVIWNNINNRGEFLRASLDSEWFISFREPHPDSGILPIAYIWRKY